MNPVSCQPCCGTTVQVTNIPGVQGDDGADASNGVDAFTLVAADFIVPAVDANVTAAVQNSTWMAIGQTLVTDGPATFQVVSKPSASSVVLKFLGYTGDVAPGSTIAANAIVSPAGVQFNPTQPSFAANLNGVDQAGIVTATPTQLQFSNEVFDNNSDYDVTTYTFTPTVAGIYLFTVSAEVKSLADAKTVTVFIYKNGVAVAQSKSMTSASASGQAQLNFRAEANGTTDAFTAYVQHDGGSNKDVDGSNLKSFFQANFVGNS